MDGGGGGHSCTSGSGPTHVYQVIIEQVGVQRYIQDIIFGYSPVLLNAYIKMKVKTIRLKLINFWQVKQVKTYIIFEQKVYLHTGITRF